MGGFNLFRNEGVPTTLEQAGLVDTAGATLNAIAVKAGQAMSGELIKNVSGAMYLAEAAQELAKAAQEISGRVHTQQQKQQTQIPQEPRLRVK